ncbi:MAG: ArsR/SmtB family transcription factor [Candidatus Limnocylindria bacterium]
MPAQISLHDLRTFHRALGDSNRLRIVRILATEGEHSASGLVRRLGVSQPLLSWHLHRLRRAGIVRTKRVGREVRCSFDRERFAALQDRSVRGLLAPSEASG